MSQVFDDTLDYLKTREQFGVPIGSFQALKHRAARVFMEIELARSAVMAAARAVDAGDADFAKLVSLAKARCSDAFVLAANEAVQMFGGVGMTDEYDVGFYLKRARVAELTLRRRRLAPRALRATRRLLSEPTRTERFLRACRGEPVDRPPVWLMRQAGRYLPEYREMRAGVTFLEACRDVERAVEISLQPLRLVGTEAVILFSDIFMPVLGMGVELDFRPGPVIAEPIRTRDAVERSRCPIRAAAFPTSSRSCAGCAPSSPARRFRCSALRVRPSRSRRIWWKGRARRTSAR